MDNFETILERNIESFQSRKQNCAETVLLVMSEYWGIQNRIIPRIATPFGGGLSGKQSTCGAITGGLMAIGLAMGREVGGDQMPARKSAKAYVDWFEAEQGAMDCLSLIQLDLSIPGNDGIFRAQGGKHDTVCLRLVRAACAYLAHNVDIGK